MIRGIRVLDVIYPTSIITPFALSYSDTSPFRVSSVEGLGPVKATINSYKSVYKDGSYLADTSIENRNILIHLDIVDSTQFKSIEHARTHLYTRMPPTTEVILELDVESITAPIRVNGYIEYIEPNIFTNRPSVTISIICVDPYFYEDQMITVTQKGDLVDLSEHLGTAPTPYIVRKSFVQKTDEFAIFTDYMVDKMTFRGLPAGSTLEVSFDPTNRYVKVENAHGVTNPYKFLIGGNFDSRLSERKPRVLISEGTNGTTPTTVMFKRRYLGI